MHYAQVKFSEQMLQVGRQIKKNRLRNNISQVQLAQLCNIQKASISRLKAGQSNPTLFTMHKIAEVLAVPLSQFFSVARLTILSGMERKIYSSNQVSALI